MAVLLSSIVRPKTMQRRYTYGSPYISTIILLSLNRHAFTPQNNILSPSEIGVFRKKLYFPWVAVYEKGRVFLALKQIFNQHVNKELNATDSVVLNYYTHFFYLFGRSLILYKYTVFT